METQNEAQAEMNSDLDAEALHEHAMTPAEAWNNVTECMKMIKAQVADLEEMLNDFRKPLF